MTEILVQSLDEDESEIQAVQLPTNAASIQMQGFAADGTVAGGAGPLALSFSSHSSSASSGGGGGKMSSSQQSRGRERGYSQPTASVKSEPDLDTIMPLPGFGGGGVLEGKGAGYRRLAEEDSDTGSDGSGGYNSQGPSSFTTVEVLKGGVRLLSPDDCLLCSSGVESDF